MLRRLYSTREKDKRTVLNGIQNCPLSLYQRRHSEQSEESVAKLQGIPASAGMTGRDMRK